MEHQTTNYKISQALSLMITNPVFNYPFVKRVMMSFIFSERKCKSMTDDRDGATWVKVVILEVNKISFCVPDSYISLLIRKTCFNNHLKLIDFMIIDFESSFGCFIFIMLKTTYPVIDFIAANINVVFPILRSISPDLANQPLAMMWWVTFWKLSFMNLK